MMNDERAAGGAPVAASRFAATWWRLGVGLLLVGGVGYGVLGWRASGVPGDAASGARPAAPPVPVVVAAARTGDLPVILHGLGSVTAFNSVTVRSRVDGQLIRVAFEEGQLVKAGDLLAEIDARPFEAQLAQAEGQMARDRAQLADARINLERFRDLLGRNFIPRQQFDTQVAQVAQFEGVVRLDQGIIDSAKLQLSYCRITAPIDGRVGLRFVDVGNMVHASDQAGLLLITQVQPIAVLFTLPEDDLPRVLGKLHGGERLTVEAYDRAGQTKIAAGSLVSMDNQIDQSTGTTRLKAVFDNADNGLFPNQFVNARLLLDTKRGVTIVPVAGIQRGPSGTFVYVVKADETVEVRPVTVGPTVGLDVAIESGLNAGERIVTDGVERLRAGSAVRIRSAESGAAGQRPGA